MYLQASLDYPPRVRDCVRMVASASRPPQGEHPLQQPSYLLFPSIEAKGWWEREDERIEPLVQKLEDAFPTIKEECLALIKTMEEAGEGWPPQKDAQQLEDESKPYE